MDYPIHSRRPDLIVINKKITELKKSKKLQIYILPKIWFDLVSLIDSISTTVGYLMPKPSLEKNNHGII